MSTLVNAIESVRQSNVISSEEQLAEYTSALLHLTARPQPTPEENEAIKLLTLLIERYEATHHPVRKAHPIGVLRSLMVEHWLTEKDLIEVFGDEGIVSQVLSGKRQMSREHIARLSFRFNVSPKAFFQARC